MDTLGNPIDISIFDDINTTSKGLAMVEVHVTRITNSNMSMDYCVFLADGNFGYGYSWIAVFEDFERQGIKPYIDGNTIYVNRVYGDSPPVNVTSKWVNEYQELGSYCRELPLPLARVNGFELVRSSMMGEDVLETSPNKSLLESKAKHLNNKEDDDHSYFEYYVR